MSNTNRTGRPKVFDRVTANRAAVTTSPADARMRLPASIPLPDTMVPKRTVMRAMTTRTSTSVNARRPAFAGCRSTHSSRLCITSPWIPYCVPVASPFGTRMSSGVPFFLSGPLEATVTSSSVHDN